MHLTSFTHALAIVRAHAHVLAHCTHTEYTVRVLAHYALRSHARNLATVYHACEWQRASTRELLCNARARTFKTHYTTKLHSTIIRAWPSRITLKLHLCYSIMDVDIQIMYIFFLGCFMVTSTRVLRIIGTVNGNNDCKT